MGVLLERGAQERLARHEGHDELGRLLELLPIGLVGQQVNVRPDLTGVVCQMGPPRSFLRSVIGIEERLKRDLGVDNDELRAGKVHHHVGPLAPILRGGGNLLLEVAVLQHPRHLDHAV